jgi:cyclopropane fatty-acyl-phospholipid synthase-like methyltransferase
MLDVVEHLTPTELDRTLAQARRILAPGGRLYIHTFPNR